MANEYEDPLSPGLRKGMEEVSKELDARLSDGRGMANEYEDPLSPGLRKGMKEISKELDARLSDGRNKAEPRLPHDIESTLSNGDYDELEYPETRKLKSQKPKQRRGGARSSVINKRLASIENADGDSSALSAAGDAELPIDMSVDVLQTTALTTLTDGHDEHVSRLQNAYRTGKTVIVAEFEALRQEDPTVLGSIRFQEQTVVVDSSFDLWNGDKGNRLSGKEGDISSLKSRVLPLPAGSIPYNGTFNGIAIPAGIILLVAPSGVGKSPFAQALARSVQASTPSAKNTAPGIVRTGEPFIGYQHSRLQVAASIALGIASFDALVVDSIKDLLSSDGGAAMKGGISRSAIGVLSDWGAAAAACGCTMIVPVNPGVDDPDTYNAVVQACRSNGTATFWSDGNSDRWDYDIRTGEGLARATGSISSIVPSPGASNASVGVNDSYLNTRFQKENLDLIMPRDGSF